jgi:hypothetical protein
MRYFSCSGGSGADAIKSTLRHVMPNLCFSIRCVLLHAGREMSTHNFSCIGGPGVDPIKSALGHIVHSGASSE